MGSILAWFTAERVGLISVGAVLVSLARWLYLQFHGNRLPLAGEPLVYVAQVTSRLPNGRVYRMSVHNSSPGPIWLEQLIPRSRAFGSILQVPNSALSEGVVCLLDTTQGRASLTLQRHLDSGSSVDYLVWIGGLEWPIWKFATLLRWSPYGPAARMLTTIVHCAT